MRASDKLGKGHQLQLWTILAQMFIANELGIFHLKQLAQKIVDTIGTSMTINEIENVLVNEVGPNFLLNFSPFNTFPEDLGWDEQEVENIMNNVGFIDRIWRYLVHRNALKNARIKYSIDWLQ